VPAGVVRCVDSCAFVRIADRALRLGLELLRGVREEGAPTRRREPREIGRVGACRRFVRRRRRSEKARPDEGPSGERVERTARTRPLVDDRERSRSIDPRARVSGREPRRLEVAREERGIGRTQEDLVGCRVRIRVGRGQLERTRDQGPGTLEGIEDVEGARRSRVLRCLHTERDACGTGASPRDRGRLRGVEDARAVGCSGRLGAEQDFEGHGRREESTHVLIVRHI